MSKYHSRAKWIDGLYFDSSAEALHYQELRLLERTGVISALRVHPKFVVADAIDGERPIVYEADFEYVQGDSIVVEDVKGYETDTWRLKWRLARLRYPDRVWKVVKA